MDVSLWLRIPLYVVAGVAGVAVLYLLVLTAVRHAMRDPIAEARKSRRRQEDLLREISASAAYLADVADAWAEGEAERRAATAWSRPVDFDDESSRPAEVEPRADADPAAEADPDATFLEDDDEPVRSGTSRSS
jgi:hypothetical protein